MSAKQLSIAVAAIGLCGIVATTTYATDMGTSRSGASAQAQVGTQGAGAGAQVGTPAGSAGAQVGTQPGSGTKVQVETSAGAPITGTFTLKDPAMRTFTVAGQSQVYVAPETIDLKQFEGQNVTITFDPNGRVSNIQIDREG